MKTKTMDKANKIHVQATPIFRLSNTRRRELEK